MWRLSLRHRSGEIVEMLECLTVHICCVHETRFWKNSVRIINGKAAEYKLFCVGNGKALEGVGILLTTKWENKVVDISRESDKVLVQGIIIPVVGICAPQCGLNDSKKDNFYDNLITIVRKLGEDILVIAGDFNGHVGNTV